MGEKNPKDMLSKASWTLMEVMKDAATSNLTTALRTGQLDIKGDQVAKLMTIVGASLEEGYHKGFRSFTKVIDAATEESKVIALREAKKNRG
jgi:hypothetical protein